MAEEKKTVKKASLKKLPNQKLLRKSPQRLAMLTA